jgi:hypothetical protein
MAVLGNIGVDRKKADTSKLTLFAWTKQVSVTATVTAGIANELVYLFKEGAICARIGVNNSNAATFYDLEDGEFQVRETIADSHAWKVVVSGATVTVTPLTPGGGGSGTTRAYSFLGT